MRIMYINNAGGGFANYVEIENSTSIDKLFKDKMPNEEPHDYLIRVNRQPVPKDYILRENDRVTITPTKVEGAACQNS